MSTMRLRATLLASGLALLALAPASAPASWQGAGSDAASARAHRLGSVAQPTTSVANRTVVVTWTAPASGAPVTGYLVRRYDESGNAQTIGAGCSATIATTRCTETAVPPGTWRYRVTAVNANWRSAESAPSAAVTIAGPALSLNQSSVTSLPARLSGQITNFASGQTVSFRLDSSTGPALSGTIAPTPVPASGTANVSVTLPTGTASGSHTIYARGSAGDSATAQISVLQAQTLTTSAWNLRDASAGGPEVDASDPIAFAADGRTVATSTPPASFSTSRYLQIDANGPLPTNASPTSATFNIRFAAGAGSSTACFYFDLRRASTNAVLATHGSSANPVGCVTGTAQTSFSTALTAASSTAIANDLRVRVYVRTSGARAPVVDQAALSVVSSSGTFALNDEDFTDQLSGNATDRTWPLVARGGTTYPSASTWPTAFSSSRYLRLTFPAYVTSAVTVSGASFLHRFRRAGGGSVCWYLQVLQGTTVIGTHGSAASPISCTTGNAYRTDSVSLPEINSPARANGAVLKIYLRSTTGRSSEHDRAQMTIDYAN
jgi:hypothetical protein